MYKFFPKGESWTWEQRYPAEEWRAKRSNKVRKSIEVSSSTDGMLAHHGAAVKQAGQTLPLGTETPGGKCPISSRDNDNSPFRSSTLNSPQTQVKAAAISIRVTPPC